MIELFLIPLGPYLLVTAGAVACLYIFFSLKTEIQELRMRCAERDTRLQGMFEDMERQMEHFNHSTQYAEEGAGGRVANARR